MHYWSQTFSIVLFTRRKVSSHLHWYYYLYNLKITTYFIKFTFFKAFLFVCFDFLVWYTYYLINVILVNTSWVIPSYSFPFCNMSYHSLRFWKHPVMVSAEFGVMMMMMMWWIVFVVWLIDKRRLALFPARTIVRDLQHHESLTCRKQGLNLCRT